MHKNKSKTEITDIEIGRIFDSGKTIFHAQISVLLKYLSFIEASHSAQIPDNVFPLLEWIQINDPHVESESCLQRQIEALQSTISASQSKRALIRNKGFKEKVKRIQLLLDSQ